MSEKLVESHPEGPLAKDSRAETLADERLIISDVPWLLRLITNHQTSES